MHIILAILGAVITILILFRRLNDAGIDIGWLNPFAWQRRRKFRVEHDLNPIFKLSSPLDVAAVYIVSVAKVDGDITASQKTNILEIFQSDFHLSEEKAKELLGSSVYLIGNGNEFYTNPERVIERAYDAFSQEQIDSTSTLIEQIAQIDGTPTSEQMNLIGKIKKALKPNEKTEW